MAMGNAAIYGLENARFIRNY